MESHTTANFTFTSLKKRFAASFALSSLLVLNSFWYVQPAQAQAYVEPPLADDTLIVRLAPHSDRNKFGRDLYNESGTQVVEDFHVDRSDYSIMQVQGPAGQREVSLAKIKHMMANHPEIKSVHRNYLAKHFIDSAPSDPDYTQQWPLTSMNWLQARQTYYTNQKQSAHITVIGSGTHPVAKSNELGAYITQWNATKANVVQEAVAGYDVEGDVDTSITGCLTDNSYLLSGAASFVSALPCYITNVRVTSNGSASYANIYRGLTWCINNQAKRGGPGPVNLSYGQAYPAAPVWSDSEMQTLGTELLNQGDILCVAAGDTPGTYTSYPPNGHMAVIQGTASNNTFYSRYLTLVQNDHDGAPGAVQPAVINGKFNTNYYGSSFSSPLWCAAIAMVIACNPSLTSYQAHLLVIQNGTPISGSAWSAVVPNFAGAINAAVNQ